MSDLFLIVWSGLYISLLSFVVIVLPGVFISLVIVEIVLALDRRFEKFCDALERRKP